MASGTMLSLFTRAARTTTSCSWHLSCLALLSLTGGLGRRLALRGERLQGSSDCLFRDLRTRVTVGGGGDLRHRASAPGTGPRAVGRDPIQDFSRGRAATRSPRTDPCRPRHVRRQLRSTFVGTAVPDKGELGFVRSGPATIVRGTPTTTFKPTSRSSSAASTSSARERSRRRPLIRQGVPVPASETALSDNT